MNDHHHVLARYTRIARDAHCRRSSSCASPPRGSSGDRRTLRSNSRSSASRRSSRWARASCSPARCSCCGCAGAARRGRACAQWRNALVVGSLMLAAGMGSVAVAEQTIGSGLVVAFTAAVPLLIAALNLVWGVKPGRLELAGIAVGIAGIALLTQGASFQASPGGLFAMAVACIGWSLGSVLSQRSLTLAPGAMGFASEMLGGGVVLLVLSALNGETPRWPPEPLALAAWWYLVVFGSLIAFNAYMVLLARASAALASSYTLVTPVIGMLLGVAIAGEVVTRDEWLAVDASCCRAWCCCCAGRRALTLPFPRARVGRPRRLADRGERRAARDHVGGQLQVQQASGGRSPAPRRMPARTAPSRRPSKRASRRRARARRSRGCTGRCRSRALGTRAPDACGSCRRLPLSTTMLISLPSPRPAS